MQTSLANGHSVIAIRGLANLAGSEEEGEDSSESYDVKTFSVSNFVKLNKQG